MARERPSCGSCPTCLRALDLRSRQVRGVWYCSSACAEGRPGQPAPASAVAEARLVPQPRRFFRPRRPKELNPPSDR